MPPAPTSALAFVTTVHLGLLVLRKHRLPAGAFPWALFPSLLFCAAPWVFQSAAAVAAGLALHLAWFAACERLIPATGSSAPADFVPVPVLAVIDESPTIRTFRLARPASFTFQAGQFLTVRVQADGRQHVRCYSISSAPEAAGYLEISVKRQGLVSGVLHATLRPGAPLLVKMPAGRFTYPSGDDRPLVLVAGGVGITPLISMLRHGVTADPGRPITLLYSARGRRELAFLDELNGLARRHPHVRLIATVTEPSADWQDRVGRIDRALIANYVPNAAHSVFLMCGPLGMIGEIRETLLAMGVPDAQVSAEVFHPATAIGAQARPTVEALGAGHDVVAGPAGAANLELVRSRRTVEVAEDQTLLDAAEAGGADIPTLCRAGVCGTCRTRLVSGDARCTSDALDERDRRAGYVLPCVTWARGDCGLEA
jgi:ferredoxin-NADP reductase